MATKSGIPYKWISVMVIATGTLMVTLDAGMVRITLPHFGDLFGVDPNTVIWLTLIYMLIGTGLMLTLGRMGDVFGRKRLYTFGLLVFSLGLGLCAIAQNFIQLLIFRLILSIGGATTVANGNAIVASSFPPEERGRAMGIMVSIVGIGLAGGPALGGLILESLGWQAIFYLRLPIGIMAAVLVFFLIKQQPTAKQSGKFDLLGAITIFITMACLLLSINRGQSLGWTSAFVLSLAAISIVAFIFFFFIERRAAQPVVDLGLFRSRLLSVASATHVLAYLGSAGMNFLMPFLLIQGLNYTASVSGYIVTMVPLVYVFLAPLSGRLSERIGTLPLCTLGLTSLSAGLFLLRGLDTSSSTIDIIWRLLIVGIGMATFSAPNVSAIMGSVPKERLGTASAMVATVRQIGMSTGMAIAGTIFTAVRDSEASNLTSQGLSESAVISLSTVSGFRVAIFVATGFAIISTVVSTLRGRAR